jgi:antitoxin component YwqK of YwqJK toxin-antitoxin module
VAIIWLLALQKYYSVLRKAINALNDQAVDVKQYWSESGELIREESYDNGVLEKSVEYQDGQPVKTILYKDGEPIEEKK